MITKKQIKNLKKGNRLIFFQNGGVLSTDKGNVFTFSNWWEDDKYYWQCKELLSMGNRTHNFSIYDLELFDPQKHKQFNIMDEQKITGGEKEFIRKYGA